MSYSKTEEIRIDKNIHFRPKRQKYVDLINFMMEKHRVDKSKAIRLIFDKCIALQKENTTLKNDNQFLQEAMNLSTSDKNTINKALYPECEDGYSIKEEPSKRECGRKDKDRFVNLPKINGKFTVDNPKKCERCQKIERRIIQLQIERRGKVTHKDVLVAEAKKSLYQHAENKAKEQDQQLRKIRESMKPHLQSIKRTLDNEKTMLNGGSNKNEEYLKTDAQGRRYFLGYASQRVDTF